MANAGRCFQLAAWMHDDVNPDLRVDKGLLVKSTCAPFPAVALPFLKLSFYFLAELQGSSRQLRVKSFSALTTVYILGFVSCLLVAGLVRSPSQSWEGRPAHFLHGHYRCACFCAVA